jgi:hypothetical protein
VYNTMYSVLRLRAFFKDFPVGGGGEFFEKGPLCEIIY